MVLEPSDADVRNLDPFLSGHVGHDVRAAFRLYPERGPRYDLCERGRASRSYLGAFGSGLNKVQAALLPLEEVETISTLAGYSLMTETEVPASVWV